MLGALIIVFREVIEAGIIVGIVMAVTKGVRGSRLMAGAGVAPAFSAPPWSPPSPAPSPTR